MSKLVPILIRVPEKDLKDFDSKIKKLYPNVTVSRTEVIRNLIHNYVERK